MHVVINSLENCLVAIIVNQMRGDTWYLLGWQSVLDPWNSFTPSYSWIQLQLDAHFNQIF